MLSFLFDIIAPKRCVICKKYGSLFCEECVKKIYKREPYCYLCKKPSSHFFLHPSCKQDSKNFSEIHQIIVFGHYNGSLLKKVIQHAKFYKKRELLKELSFLLSQTLQQNVNILVKEKYVLISPPMHFLRRWKRGYNHSALLSKFLSERTWIIDVSNYLTKSRATKQQSKLQKQARMNNLKWAYKLCKKAIPIIQWKVCIVVDDVISTGSTLIEIKDILIQFWAKEVVGLIVASE